MLKDNERLDDLEYKGLKIIQNYEGYCFTSDAVLLANLARVLPKQKVADLGTGSGIVAILIAAKSRASQVVGIELQERLADMASRSVIYNGLQDKIKIMNIPMQDAFKEIGADFDVVVTNPPYEKPLKKENPTEIDICKQEYCITLSEVINSADKLLKYGGLFYMINKAKRLAEIIFYMKERNIEPKKIIMIQPKAAKDIDTVIVEGKKGGKPSLVIPKPLIVYNEDGSFTEEARRIYNK